MASGALAHALKGLGFDSGSRACTWVVGSLLAPCLGTCGRQPMDVSLSHQCVPLSLHPTLSEKQ